MLPDSAATLADDQRGVLARRQLVRLCGRQRADDLLRSGRFTALDPPVRGVHRLRGSGAGFEQYAFGATLRAGPGATLTGPLALGLFRVPGFDPPAPFEVLLRPGRRLQNVAFQLRRDPDPDRPVAWHGEVQVAGPVDALIDSAGFVDQVGERPLRVAWDHLRWNGLARPHRLANRLDELDGAAPGARILRRVLQDTGGLEVESEGERALAPVLRCFEPAPEPQAWVTSRRRVDFLFRSLQLAYEYLGAVDHGTIEQRAADDARDDELQRAGVQVQYVVARDLDDRVALLARVTGVLVVRAHQLGLAPPAPRRPLPT